VDLTDLFFWTGAKNRTGLDNIRGDELAALITAASGGANRGASVGVERPALFSVPTGFAGYIVEFSAAAEFDDLGFFDPADNTKLTIPVTDPPISRVLLRALTVWSPVVVGSAFHAAILKAGGASLEADQSTNNLTGTAVTTFCSVTMIEDVVPGDVFTLRAYHILSAGNVNLARANMALTVLR
jgi:hypothetical protein